MATPEDGARHIFELDQVPDATQLVHQLKARTPFGLALHERIRTALSQVASLQDGTHTSLRDINTTLYSSFDARQDAWPEIFVIVLFHPACLEGTSLTVVTSLELNDAEQGERHQAQVSRLFTYIFARIRTDPMKEHLVRGWLGAEKLLISTCDRRNLPALDLTKTMLLQEHSFDSLFFKQDKIVTRPEDDILPDGVIFDSVRLGDMEAVAATNQFVRSQDVIGSWTGLGIREKESGRLVAWGFFGLHGSVRTVYVQEHWRGRGLARKLIARMLTPRASGTLPTDRREARIWMHAQVLPENTASQRLNLGLGAFKVGQVCWPQVHLDKLQI